MREDRGRVVWCPYIEHILPLMISRYRGVTCEERACLPRNVVTSCERNMRKEDDKTWTLITARQCGGSLMIEIQTFRLKSDPPVRVRLESQWQIDVHREHSRLCDDS